MFNLMKKKEKSCTSCDEQFPVCFGEFNPESRTLVLSVAPCVTVIVNGVAISFPPCVLESQPGACSTPADLGMRPVPLRLAKSSKH